MQFERRTMLVDGLVTSYLEAGRGDPVVLLHGGEFGASAEIGWERNIAALAEQHRVLARTCWALANRRKSSTSTTGAVCGSGMWPDSAPSWASTPRTSWAIRWVPSCCSPTPRRIRRGCRCAAWW
ncbi:hypothetical protein I553_4724 [Mycobacterium xenopi 4042]|uniref:Alpha/beta hydrolase family protein n=1 Tax=Mycobacterium xenopi 4042 TaxID=1299334 RepID=X8AEX7_MYCXE|nr:hypothetical protein I553_4724 [Mycobacterium xenopi 4042]